MHDSVIETLYTLAEDLLSYVSRILARRNSGVLSVDWQFIPSLLEGYYVLTESALQYKALFLNAA
jgi:hypothetical protein